MNVRYDLVARSSAISWLFEKKMSIGDFHIPADLRVRLWSKATGRLFLIFVFSVFAIAIMFKSDIKKNLE